MDEKVYKGYRMPDGTVRVIVATPDGHSQDLPHHVRHSPDGYEWGYLGSGPAELARCLLFDATQDWTVTGVLYQDFKEDVVACWPTQTSYRLGDSRPLRCWALPHSMIMGWVNARKEQVARYKEVYGSMDEVS